jgi:anti-anti-sigma factor
VSEDLRLASVSANSEIVVFPAEVDVLNAGIVVAALCAVLARGVRVVVADMTSTVFCDCAGLAALAAADREARSQSADLRIVACGTQVLRVLEVTGTAAVLTVHPTVAAALGGPCSAECVQPDA